MLLSKKVTQRCCNINKLKMTSLFDNYNWDDLIDYKAKPPYVPETMDWTKNLANSTIPYETALLVKIIFNILSIFSFFYFLNFLFFSFLE